MEPINKTILFNKSTIHYLPDSDRTVEWLCLNDICKVLQRREMMERGEAVALCRTSTQFPIYTNGKLFWFIRVYDLQSLTNKVRRENKHIARLCDELLKWACGLPVSLSSKEAPPVIAGEEGPVENVEVKEDKNELVIFQYKDQPISFKAENGKTYFNATEMARSFGKNPREWLTLAQTKQFRQSLVDRGKSESLESQIITSRGSFGTTWIEEKLGLEFSRWLSPEFGSWCNDRMQELFTRGIVTLEAEDDKDALYATSYGIRKKIPTTYKEALMQLVVAEETIEKQQGKIEEDKPKVEFYDSFIGERNSFRTSIIADELGISLIRLYQFLKEERIVRWVGTYYETYPSHQSLQCDHPYYWTNPRTGKTYAFSKTKRWTKTGREFVLELYRKKNPK